MYIKIYNTIKNQINKALNYVTDKEALVIICNKLLYELKYKSIHGQKALYIAPTIIYIAYNKLKKPKTVYQIINLFENQEQYNGIGKKELFKELRKIKKLIGIQFCEQVSMMGTQCMYLVKPEQYIDTFCKNLRVSNRVNETARKLLKKYVSIPSKLSGKNAKGLAASSIYIALLIEGEHRTQRTLAEIAEVTEVTIRKNYKDMLISLDKDLEKMFRINKDGLN